MKTPSAPIKNADRYLAGRGDPTARYASFDHCHNYFRGHWESGRAGNLCDADTRQLSCLHLGYYLASWGMFRGKAALLQRSSRALVPAVEAIANAPDLIWKADVEHYDETTIDELLSFGLRLGATLPGGQSDTLVTKTMLGAFGCVPAFDRYFRLGFGTSGFRKKALTEIRSYYVEHCDEIESRRVATLDFEGRTTARRYTQAKVIDMIFFVEGGGTGS